MINAASDQTVTGSAATVVMDVGQLPDSQRIGAWTEALYEQYYPLDVAASAEEFRRGELRILDLPGVRLGALDSDSYQVHRRRSHAAVNSDDFYFVPIPLQQPLGLQQGGRDTLLRPGDATVINTSGAYAFLQHTGNRIATMRLDGPRMRARLPFIDDVVAVPFSNDSALTAVLVDFALSVLHRADGLDARTTDALSDQIFDLIGLTLTAQANAHESTESSIRLAHLRRIIREIDTKLECFDMGVDVIAGSLGLSRRYVQRLVAERGETVSGLIRDRRIATARRRLADPALASMSVSSIGHSVGFADPARFSRTFRNATDCSPGEFRRQVQSHLRPGNPLPI